MADLITVQEYKNAEGLGSQTSQSQRARSVCFRGRSTDSEARTEAATRPHEAQAGGWRSSVSDAGERWMASDTSPPKCL